jgi:hypothetical protein
MNAPTPADERPIRTRARAALRSAWRDFRGSGPRRPRRKFLGTAAPGPHLSSTWCRRRQLSWQLRVTLPLAGRRVGASFGPQPLAGAMIFPRPRTRTSREAASRNLTRRRPGACSPAPSGYLHRFPFLRALIYGLAAGGRRRGRGPYAPPPPVYPDGIVEAHFTSPLQRANLRAWRLFLDISLFSRPFLFLFLYGHSK